MHAYISVSFYIGVTMFVLRSLVMACVPYPRERKVTLAEDTAASLLSLGFILWAGFLLFH